MSTRANIVVYDPEEKVYLRIYHHADSYIDGGLGEYLIDNIKTNMEALNLVRRGDASSVMTNPPWFYGEKNKWNRECNEDWDNVKPRKIESKEEALWLENEYLYYFDACRNEWLVSNYMYDLASVRKCLEAKRSENNSD